MPRPMLLPWPDLLSSPFHVQGLLYRWAQLQWVAA